MTTFVLPYTNSKPAVLFLVCLTIFIGCTALLLWTAFGSVFKNYLQNMIKNKCNNVRVAYLFGNCNFLKLACL